MRVRIPAIDVSVGPAACVDGDAFAAPGRGRLAIARHAGRSVVTRAFATSPLRLLTPRNHGRAAWIYTSHYGGGLVDGDGVDLDVTIFSGATAFLSTQASTKIYRSPHGTSTRLTARVDAGGVLIVAPDPVVCFAGARYRQAQRFHVAEGGGLVVLDSIVAGRCASGERWAFSEYRSLLEIRVGERLLLHDAIALRQADGPLAKRLGRFDVLAVAAVIGEMFTGDASTLVADWGAHPVRRRPDELMSASPLTGGCILRVAGRSVERVARMLRESLGFITRELGDDPWSRKF